MLTISNLTYRIAGRTLLQEATAFVPEGARVGLVGLNGSGKSTLFRLMQKEISPESGSLSVPKGMRIGQVAQEAPSGSERLIDVVLAADEERLALLEEADTCEDPERISEIHIRLADIHAHSAPSRAASILHGLGFDAAAQEKPCSDFSGGWRMRVALAALLFSEPDLLLLDEPTNYLDLEGTLWLEAYLARYPRTIIIISHDRSLLNSSVDTILHLSECKLKEYRGGYDQFERQRREQQRLQSKLQVKQDAQRKHMEAFVERFRYKASKARQAQSRLKALEKLKPIASLVEEQVGDFRFKDPEIELSPPIVNLNGVATGYGNTVVLSGLNLRIDQDDRIGLVGSNGNGKSTLAKLLSNRLQTLEGKITSASKLKVGYFAQHQIDELYPAETPIEHLRRIMAGLSEAQLRARVDQMGLTTSRMDTKVSHLSGGEKARLMLGLATYDGPHLMILDEPTNHLDIDSRAAMIQALNAYKGAVIIISHDNHILETCTDRLWLVANGTVKTFDGDIDDYKKYVLQKDGKKPDVKKSVTPVTEGAVTRRSAAERRAMSATIKKRISKLDAEIARCQSFLERADNELADGQLFSSDPDKANHILRQRAKAQSALEAAEEAWLQAGEELERMQ